MKKEITKFDSSPKINHDSDDDIVESIPEFHYNPKINNDSSDVDEAPKIIFEDVSESDTEEDA